MRSGETLWVLLTILLHLGAREGPVLAVSADKRFANTDLDYDTDDCEIHYNWTSPYVTALYNSEREGAPKPPKGALGTRANCASIEAGSLGRPRRLVHVINIPAVTGLLKLDQNAQLGLIGQLDTKLPQQNTANNQQLAGQITQQQLAEQNLTQQELANKNQLAQQQPIGKQQLTQRQQLTQKQLQQQQQLAQSQGQTGSKRSRDRSSSRERDRERDRRKDTREQRRRRVEIHIKSSHVQDDSKPMVRGRRLVFVLNSELTGVLWRLNLENRLCSINRCLFWVSFNSFNPNYAFWRRTHSISNNSRLENGKDLNLVVQHFNPAKDKGSLQQLVNRKFNVRPVVQETVAEVTTVELTVELESCNEAGTDGADITEKHVNGCVARWNQDINNKDVHVLEVLPEKISGRARGSGGPARSAGGPSGGLPTVTLELQPRSGDVKKHLLVVIKSHEKMLWRVRTRGLRGTLSIVTDQAVDTGSIEMQSVQVVNEALDSVSGINLSYWTADKYGRAVSYTQVPYRPSIVRIVVDGGADLPAVNPRWSQQGGSGKGGSAGNKGGTGAPEGRRLDEDDVRRRELIRGREVQCGERGVVVSLWKTTLQRLGVEREGLSLVDRSCQLQENSTHFYWSFNHSQCGTKMRRTGGGVSYDNMIVVTYDPAALKASREGSRRSRREDDWHPVHVESSGEGKGWDGRGENGRGEEDWINVDDEAGEDEPVDLIIEEERVAVEDDSELLMVDQDLFGFSCDYSPSGDVISKKTQPEFILRLYEDQAFSKEFSTSPLSILEHSTVYVQVSKSTGEDGLGLNLLECSLQAESSSSSSSSSRHHDRTTILKNGCPVRSPADVQMITTHSGDVATRFSFSARRLSSDSATLILTCEVSQCRKPSLYNPDIPPCTQAGSGCEGRIGIRSETWFVGPVVLNLRSERLSGGDQHSSFHTGELRNSVTTRGGDTTKSTKPSRVAAQCDQTVQVEGLSATVVIGIAFASFIIGIGLTAAIWYIHSCTALPGKKKRVRGLPLAESGDSTPNSVTASIPRSTNQRA